MSEAAASDSPTTLWNVAAPLHVLLIENSHADAELNIRELQYAGFQCRPQIVCTHAEFLEQLRRFPFDIVLADYRLPGWTGMDAFAAMRRAGRDVPFILVTGILGEEVAVECIKQGITDYVLKEHLARLPLVVARALEERALRDAQNFMVQALRESEANSLFLFEHNPLPMWVFDRETLEILQVNEAAARHHGYSRTEFLAMRASDLHPAEEVPQLLAAFRSAAVPQEKFAGQWHHLRKGGTPLDVELLLHTMEYAGHAAALVVAQDVTERRALEQQLQHAQKFEVIGQLAGGLAHDFNNAIGAILGWAELGEEQATAIDPRLAGYFIKIHRQCDRVTALARQLLAFARRQILEPRNLSLNQTVQDVLNLLDKVIGKDIEVQTALAENLWAIRADPAQIEQVLMNLCLNSRDAMPKGGRLTIETRNTVVSEEHCGRDTGLLPGSFAELLVKDTGIGMDAAVRERIFEPFFTTKGPGNGTGLGLATAYGIVKQHGGLIHVESEPGRGSTFRVLLPANPASEKLERRRVTVENAPIRGGRETILIAEDHEGIREMAHAVLKGKGYDILLAHDGEEAVELFTANRERISLVILDVIMPRRSGPEVFAAIQALKPGISAVFATGYSNEMATLAEIVARGIAVLRKPYSPSTLCRVVREVLDGAAATTSTAK
jgi:two-component system cell cycle sensor histidine kinase/response regulator CckA